MNEVEIKFAVADVSAMLLALERAGFREVTKSTPETNTIYDRADGSLRAAGELLRLREYGDRWTLTYKGAAVAGARHKTRREIETAVEDGAAMHEVLLSLGYGPKFRYEKLRSEFAREGQAGHVVVDRTPIGDFGEIEGDAAWIDAVAAELGVKESKYINASYARLFEAWRERTGSTAREMTWAATGGIPPVIL